MMNRTRRRRQMAVAKIAILSAWIALVAVVLLWQATQYTGVMAVLGEWQFNAIGRHYPTFNYAFLVFVLSLPGYILFLRPRRRATTDLPGTGTVRSAILFMRAIFGTAAGLGAACLVVLIATLFLPGDAGPVQRIALNQAIIALPHEGLTQLSGHIIYERTAGFDEELVAVRRSSRYAPMVAPGDTTTDLQFFVQLPPVEGSAREGTSTMTGILKRNGLPGAIVRLYRYAGYDLANPHFVLFADAATMRWPYLITAFQLAFGGLVMAAAGLWQRRRIGRLRAAKRTLDPS
jgi:hypothetical protein